MKRPFAKKTALLTLVIVVFALCALFFFACKGAVSLDLVLKGELLPGESLAAEFELTGGGKAVEEYSDGEYTLVVTDGKEIAEIVEGKVRIAETAKKGDSFTLRLTLKDLSVEKTFTVKDTSVRKVTLLAPETAEAGEIVTLSCEAEPFDATVDLTPTYTLLSGEATLAGATLTVSDRADYGAITVKVTVGGVSAEKRITVTTRQTKELSLTLSRNKALPERSVTFTCEATPSEGSFPVAFSLEKGGEYAELDETERTVTVRSTAPLSSEIVLLARSGYCEERATIVVAPPDAESLSVRGGGTAIPGSNYAITYSLLPEEAEQTAKISLIEGEAYVEWSGGASFKVNADAPQGAEITFLVEANEKVYKSISYRVEDRAPVSIEIDLKGNPSTSYLRSGESLTFLCRTDPEGYEGEVVYRATQGADLVTIEGDTVTVKGEADIGQVTIVAEYLDGTVSNEIDFTVSGRYSRKAYSSWSNVSLATSGESASVWMVLPVDLNAGSLTVIVPSEVSDLVIEGRYDGREDSAYRDLYFYFRNTPERTVTLWNFGTVATQGLGGTVLDLGSSGKTEIFLKGDNLVKADSPYFLDTMGENGDGVWNNGFIYEGQLLSRRRGKNGYRGAAGGTAISGHTLTFLGEGTLRAVAGSGTNGTAGGKGADAEYSSLVSTYLSGAGGAGGHGGDSGSAIYAYAVTFGSGLVTAIPGDAGVGGVGGAEGATTSLVGRDVTILSGGAGANGKNGVAYPAVNAKSITGANYLSSTGTVKSLEETYDGTLTNLTEKLARFYGVALRFGSALENPYSDYKMTQQTDYTELMRQTNFLMYAMSATPKNCWQEVRYYGISKKQVTIYLCNKITSGSSNVLGLTSDKNNVWFATFDVELRGVWYSTYYNIMLHEFTHVFHYNFSTSARSAFEKELKKLNLGLSYIKRYSSTNEAVYGVNPKYNETNSCFLTNYSRKNEMEDTSEMISIVSTFLSPEPPLKADTNIRKKYDLLVEAFCREFETLSPFETHYALFAYPHLFESERV